MLKKFKEVYFKKTGKELAEKLASGYYHNNKIQIDNVFTQIMEYSESQYFHSILAGFKNYKTKSNRNLLDLVIDNKNITGMKHISLKFPRSLFMDNSPSFVLEFVVRVALSILKTAPLLCQKKFSDKQPQHFLHLY